MEKSKKLVIVGDSAFAEIAYEYFTHDSVYDVCAFAVERKYRKKNEMCGLVVIDFEEITSLYAPDEYEVYVAITYIGLNRVRERLAYRGKELGYKLASYISTKAFVWKNVKVGEHVFIFESNTIQPYACIDDNTVLWSGNHIGHHTYIGKSCFISSQVTVSGFCKVGDYSFFGVNSAIANNVVVGKDNFIGPSIFISKDTEDGKMFVCENSAPRNVSTHKFFKIET